MSEGVGTCVCVWLCADVGLGFCSSNGGVKEGVGESTGVEFSISSVSPSVALLSIGIED